MPNISKSRFISGVQCEKKLFYDVFRNDLKPELTADQQRLFDTGHKIGLLAQKLFPEGLDASEAINGDWSVAIQRTSDYIRLNIHTIYEATFSHSRAFAALDILHHHNGERWAIEVKSSTSVKEYHIQDASLQYWVMDKCGVKPDRFFIMHINNDYVRGDVLDVRMLFTLSDVSDLVAANQAFVSMQLNKLHGVLDNGNEPVVSIGKHCDDPFSCHYKHHCWSHIPKKSVFELYSPKGKEWDLFGRGIVLLSDIPENEPLNKRQQLQLQGVKDNKSEIDKEAISAFMSKWQYPLHFFDFETVFPAVPLLKGGRPFEQIPFQYSLHIVQSNEEGEIIHKEYLSEPEWFVDEDKTDPRIALIEKMKSDFGESGSIVAYNANFEIGVIKSLAVQFPEHKTFLESLCNRFVDLWYPFQKGMYYLPQMGKSASIKSVLPAMVPELSYKELNISNGGDASGIFLSMIFGEFEGDRAQTKEDLLKYCKQDTFGMVAIWKALLEQIDI